MLGVDGAGHCDVVARSIGPFDVVVGRNRRAWRRREAPLRERVYLLSSVICGGSVMNKKG